jgi:DNA-binding NtrC family response regulator
MLSEELRYAGYDVIEAVNADEAVAVLQSSAHVDVIVSDVRMPGSMDGIELLAFVKETFPTMPVIMTSGHLQAMADTEGATKFVAKPYFLEFMVKAVDDAMAKL